MGWLKGGLKGRLQGLKATYKGTTGVEGRPKGTTSVIWPLQAWAPEGELPLALPGSSFSGTSQPVWTPGSASGHREVCTS